MPISVTDFLRFRENLPVIDVRSELEYEAGHIRGAINIPILNNQERVVVGTTYKQQGQREAIRAGFRLVGPRLNDIIDAADKASQGRDPLVYCWRGGMRSNNFCHFVGMAGLKAQPVNGGYKAYRRAALNSFARKFSVTLLTGFTGSGKSEILRALQKKGEQILDLETLASHKGSAFGGLFMGAQPTTEQFQNDLFDSMAKLDFQERVWIEDESLAIGKIFLPNAFWTTMRTGKLIRMDVTKPIRIERLVREYGHADKGVFLEIMRKIVRKLGGQHFKTAAEKLMQGDMTSTIDILLTYYDKAYTASIEGRKDQLQLTLPWDGTDPDQFAAELISQMTKDQ